MKERQEDMFPEVEKTNKNIAKLRKLERQLDTKEMLRKMKEWEKKQNKKTTASLEENPNLVNLKEDSQ